MESKMACNLSEMWSTKMPKGLDLEITHHPLTMKRVVNLIIAMERFKDGISESAQGTEFTDECLVNIMLEGMVEERDVCRTVFERAAASSQYTCMEQTKANYEVTDSEKRHLVQVPNSMELHAVMLQGGTDNCQVYLSMVSYVHHPPSTDGLIVALGIKGTNLYLSCHKDGDEPTLHLEAVENKDTLTRISPDSDMVRFLFYKQINGLNMSTFVSVPYSNWYISTAEEDNKAVEMCQETARRYRTFNLSEQKTEAEQS